jgi:hypothetical protein
LLANTDARDELCIVKRFCDIVIRARAQSLNNVSRAVPDCH